MGPPSRIAQAATMALGLTAACSAAPLDPKTMPTPIPDPISMPQSGVCGVPVPALPAPYPTEFHFRNDTAAPLYLNKDRQCAGIEYSVSSCASGFRDRLGPAYHCACSCDEASCTGPNICGGCPESEAVPVPAGGSVVVAWDGVLVTDEEKPRPNGGAPFWCVRSHPLAAGRYRVAARVFDDPMSAAAAVGGRTVTRDFELPSAERAVDVPLAAAALDSCDPTPDAAAPICRGDEARDVPCSLAEPLAFAWEGGLSFTVDSSQLTPPATYARRRQFPIEPMPDLNCTTAVPRCARDSRVVTTADITRVVSDPIVAGAFAAGTPVYGYDHRSNDGTVLILRRPDGTSLAIGGECESCARPLTPALAAVPPVLSTLEQQRIATPACAAFGPAYRY